MFNSSVIYGNRTKIKNSNNNLKIVTKGKNDNVKIIYNFDDNNLNL